MGGDDFEDFDDVVRTDACEAADFVLVLFGTTHGFEVGIGSYVLDDFVVDGAGRIVDWNEARRSGNCAGVCHSGIAGGHCGL